MTFDNNFNLLRVLAATFVIISHSYAVTGSTELEPLQVLTNGHLSFSAIGLYIFFFISGLLVTKSAMHSNNWRTFFFKRALRIYPALIIVVLLSVFAVGSMFTLLSTNEYFHSAKTWQYLETISGFKIKFFLPGVFEESYERGVNASLWTISLELKLYFILGLFMMVNLFRSSVYYIILCILIISLCLGSFFLDLSNSYSSLHPYSMKLITIFFIGSLYSIKVFPSKILSITSLIGLCILVLKVCNIFILPIPIGEILLFSSLTYLIGYRTPFIKLNNDISYGLYLIAFPIQQIVFLLSGFQQHAIANAFIALLISTIYALGSWRFIEKPFLGLKEKLS